MTTQTKTTVPSRSREVKTGWRKAKLIEVLEKVIDNRGKTPPLSNSGYPMIEVFQLSRDRKYPNMNDGKKQKFVSEQTFNTWFRSGHPRGGDILMSTVGTIAQWDLMPNGGKYCIAQNVVALRPDLSKTTPEFLRFYLNQRMFVSQVEGIVIGAAQPSVRLPHFLNLEIEIPSLDAQKCIADILSTFDDKIELNNKISRILEQMAQAIFKEWFVDFRFPGHEKIKMADSELGKVPEGWEVRKVKDVARVKKGLSYSSMEINEKSEGLPLINLASFQRGGGYKNAGIKFYTGCYSEDHVVKSGDIIIAMTDLTSNREVIGHPARVPINSWKKFLISLDVCVLKTDDLYKEYLYYLMLRKKFAYQMASSAGGTNVAHLSKSAIEEYELVLPARNVLEQLKNFISDIFEKQNVIEIENQKLAELRDLLLPKLMSGEIRV